MVYEMFIIEVLMKAYERFIGFKTLMMVYEMVIFVFKIIGFKTLMMVL